MKKDKKWLKEKYVEVFDRYGGAYKDCYVISEKEWERQHEVV